MPSRLKAHARGEVISGTGARASSKCAAAQGGRSGRRDRPTQAPRAQRARPWQSSEPTSSSQRRSKLRKLRNRLRSRSKAAWRNAAVVVASRRTVGLVLAQLVQKHRQQQGPGVVVGAVPLLEVGDGVGGVLEDPRRVGQRPEVVEPPVGELGLLLGERAHRERLERLVLAAVAAPAGRSPCNGRRTGSRSSRGPARRRGWHIARRRGSSRQQAADLPRQRRRVGERHEHAAAVGQAGPRRASTASRRSPCRNRTQYASVPEVICAGFR